MGKLRYFLTAIAYVLFSTVYSQGVFIEGQNAPDPYSAGLAKINKAVADRTAAKEASKRASNLKSFEEEDIWTIPVVVHVLHKGGPIDFDIYEISEKEALRLFNVSRYQITGALDELSERFRGTNTKPKTVSTGVSDLYGSNTLTEFELSPVSADMGIQFQLATIDPDGNPTDGIVRHDMSGSKAFMLYGALTPGFAAFDSLQYIRQDVIDESLAAGYPVYVNQIAEAYEWPGHEYINIYLIAELDDNDGGCNSSTARLTIPEGVAVGEGISNGFFWNTGFFNTGSRRASGSGDVSRYVKSIAGAFGLLPVWTGYPSCSSLLIERDSLYGDGVADTPPNVQGCGCGFRCGNPEDYDYVNGIPDYTNYMDGSCGAKFTPGQADRLRAYMEEYWPTFAISNNPRVQQVAMADIAVELTAERVGYNLYYPTAIVKNLGNTDITNWNLEVTVPGSGISVTYNQSDFGTLPSGEQFNLKLPVFQLTEFKEYDIVANVSSGQNGYGGNDQFTYSFEKVFDAPISVSASYYDFGVFSHYPHLGLIPAPGNDLYQAYTGNSLNTAFGNISESEYNTQNFLKDPRKGTQGKFNWYNAYWTETAEPLDPGASWAVNAEELRSDFALIEAGDSLILEDTYYLTEGPWRVILKGTNEVPSFYDLVASLQNGTVESPIISRMSNIRTNCQNPDAVGIGWSTGYDAEDLWCNVGLRFNGDTLFYEDQDDLYAKIASICTNPGYSSYTGDYQDWFEICQAVGSNTFFQLGGSAINPNIVAQSVDTLEDGSTVIRPWLEYVVNVSQDNPYQAPSCLAGGATGDGVCQNLGATNYNTDMTLGHVYQRNERSLHITTQINNPGYYSVDSIRYELSTSPTFDPASTEVIYVRANHIGNRNIGLVAADQKHNTRLPITVGVFDDLSPNTLYYYRAFAGNTEVSDQFVTVGFTCEGIGDSLEYNGIMYDVVSIGDQCWFARDLATDQFANGDPITSGSSTTHPRDWADNWIETMDNDPTIPLQVTPRARYNGEDVSDRGSLYNYAAVQDDRGICPIGWRVPSQQDINELYDEIRQLYGTNDPKVLKHVLYDFDHPDAISRYTNNLGFKFRSATHDSFKSNDVIPNRTWMTDQTSIWTGNEAWLQDLTDVVRPGKTIDAHAIGRFEKAVTFNSQFYIPGMTEEFASDITDLGISNSVQLQYNTNNAWNPSGPSNTLTAGGYNASPIGVIPSSYPSGTGLCDPPFPPVTYEDAVAQGCGDGPAIGFNTFMHTGSFYGDANVTYWRLMGLHPDAVDEFGNPAPDTSYTNVSTDPYYMYNEKNFRKESGEYASYRLPKGYNFTDAMWVSDAYKDHRKELWLFHPGKVANERFNISSTNEGIAVSAPYYGGPSYWDSIYTQFKEPIGEISSGVDGFGGIFNEQVLRPLIYADDFTYGELQRIGRYKKRLFIYDSQEWIGYTKEQSWNPKMRGSLSYWTGGGIAEGNGLPSEHPVSVAGMSNLINGQPWNNDPDSPFWPLPPGVTTDWDGWPKGYSNKIMSKTRDISGNEFGQVLGFRDNINMFNVPEGQNYLPTSPNVNAPDPDSTGWATSWNSTNGWYALNKLDAGIKGNYLNNEEQSIAESAFMGLRTRCVTGGTSVPDVNIGTLHSQKCAIKDTLRWGYQGGFTGDPVTGEPADAYISYYDNGIPRPMPFNTFGSSNVFDFDENGNPKSTRDIIYEDYGYVGTSGSVVNPQSQPLQEQRTQCLSWTTPCNFNLALQEEPTDENGLELDIIADDDVFIADACGDCNAVSEFLSNIESGQCDCDGNVIDALGVCGGDCVSDNNNNGICDFLEASYQQGCGDINAVTYSGHTYGVISVGPQCWFTENLRTPIFNDQTFIPEVQVASSWTGLETPARAAYDNLSANFENNGWLYNWYAVETGKLCPSGWHVPTDDDWADLERLLGMSENEVIRKAFRGTDQLIGSRVKPGGTTSLNLDAGGLRVGRSGLFKEGGEGGYFWTSTPSNDRRSSRRETAIHRAVDDNSTGIARYSDSWSTAKTMKHGLSVRCLLDSE